MSRSMPQLFDEVFPLSDNEEKVAEKKKETAKRLHSPSPRSTEHRAPKRKASKERNEAEKKEKKSHTTVSADGEVSMKPAPIPHGSKKKTPAIAPIRPVKMTAHDLFGTDSEGEEDSEPLPTPTPPPLQSVFVNRVASGLSKQVLPNKIGSHYIEVKVYRSADIEQVMPINRWRYSVSNLKIRTDMDTDVWQHLANLVMAARKEFRGTPNIFTSNFSMQL